jgi:adenylosuccinate lyase
LFPESCVLLDHIINLSIKGMRKLSVNLENVNKNLEMTKGLIMAERVMMFLANSGMGRQTGHETVRKCAMKAHDEGRHLKEVLLEEPEVMKYVSLDEIEKMFDYKTYIGLAPEIVENVLNEAKNWE